MQWIIQWTYRCLYWESSSALLCCSESPPLFPLALWFLITLALSGIQSTKSFLERRMCIQLCAGATHVTLNVTAEWPTAAPELLQQAGASLR